MKPSSLLFAAALGATLLHRALAGPAPALPPRPPIVGISHAAFYVSDLAQARAFYKDFLGFAEPYSIPRKKGGELVWIKINDHQTIELFPGSEVAPGSDRLFHIAVETTDAEAMRVYLRARGVTVPDHTSTGKIGNANYFIKDPNGNTVEIVQYLPQSWTVREQGKFLPATRVSNHMRHVGVMVGQLDASLQFYGEILGFKEVWRGSAGGKLLSWVHLRVPDGEDFVEFMLYDQPPTTERLRSMHHICLEVPDVEQAGTLLAARPLPASCKPPTPLKTGVNGKRQINYFDPDGTRIELMEPGTVNGRPVPPSSAPPPPPHKRPAAPASSS